MKLKIFSIFVVSFFAVTMISGAAKVAKKEYLNSQLDRFSSAVIGKDKAAHMTAEEIIDVVQSPSKRALFEKENNAVIRRIELYSLCSLLVELVLLFLVAILSTNFVIKISK